MKTKSALFLLLTVGLLFFALYAWAADLGLYGGGNGRGDAMAEVLGQTMDSITVTSPNGGENWTAGTSHDITWSSTGTIANVSIDYSINNGGDWINIVQPTANDGSYTWTVANNPSTNCLVRVSDAVDGTPLDTSNAVFAIIASVIDSITVAAPNGADSWTTGTSHDITWSSTGTIANVSIDYSINKGDDWINIVQSTANDGSYTWTVANNPSTNCLVRVSDAVDGTPLDTSDAVFSIVAVPSITVITPNGGESWTAGSSHDITWTSTGAIANVHIYYSPDNGSSWGVVAANTPNDGSESWTIPDESSTICLVRVRNAADTEPSDQSDAVFTIVGTVTPTITVISPNGGESWNVGSSQNITWSSTGTVGNVNISYSTDNGATWTELANNEANDGSYSATIPDTPSTTCLVFICDAVTGVTSDTSDAPFTITGAVADSITVTSPNGGESWNVGSSQNITWSSTGTVGGVDILCSTNNGASWPLVASNTANDGTYEWTVPNTPSEYCLVRIQENDGDPADQSDAVFTITQPPALHLINPNGGEHWTIGTTKTITWEATNYTGTVRLVLFKNGVRFGNVATGITAAAGSYTWTVGQTIDAGTAPAGTDYRLYLRSTDNTLSDPSDYRFYLTNPAQLQVTSPNGGESWVLGSQHAITWNANGYSGLVRLILFNKAAKIGQIAANIPVAQGSYLWTVGSYSTGTAPAGILYSIRLQATDGSQDDFSDGPLTITAGGGLVVNHLNTDLKDVPEEWLAQARGRQQLLVTGARSNDPAVLGLRLLGSRDPRLGVAGNDLRAGNGLRLQEAVWPPSGAGCDLTEWRWGLEKAILESNATVVVVRPDELALRNGRLEAGRYIAVLQELRERLAGVALVCSTVSADEPNAMLERFNRQLREHALQNNGVLLDTADIESWHAGEHALKGDAAVRHSAYRLEPGQFSAENLNHQGAAMWWLLARLTGWEGNDQTLAE